MRSGRNGRSGPNSKNLGVRFKRIERDWAIMSEELKDLRMEVNKERKNREVLEEALQGQLEEVKVTQRSNKNKHETMKWQLQVTLTKKKEGRETVEKELERVGRELQTMERQGTEGEQLKQHRL